MCIVLIESNNLLNFTSQKLSQKIPIIGGFGSISAILEDFSLIEALIGDKFFSSEKIV